MRNKKKKTLPRQKLIKDRSFTITEIFLINEFWIKKSAIRWETILL